MSCFITQLIGENGRPQSIWASPNAEAIFPNEDNHEMNSPYRIAATNIYKTKDGKYYHIHGLSPLHLVFLGYGDAGRSINFVPDRN